MARDNEEFTMIFNEVYPNLCRFLECLMSDRSAAQDIAQESFLRLFNSGRKSPPAPEARYWLFRAARNLALNELSRKQTRTRLFGKVVDMFSARMPNPQEQFEIKERKHLALDLIASLPEHQRAALLLREQEEMSYKEIALVLNVSESKVKVDIFRARNSLRDKWKKIENAQLKNLKRSQTIG